MTTQLYTISLFTENFIGLLQRVTSIFTKRKLNIESIAASESEVKGVYRYTISLRTTREKAEHVVEQLEKQVDIFKAIMHEEDETVFQEIALYKLPMDSVSTIDAIEGIIREHNARILTFTPDFVVIEKTGHPEDTEELYRRLEPIGLLEFVRSGRVAITKQMIDLTVHLQELEENFSHKKQIN
jgi:acetolactate synthase I/III small subunit